MSGTLANGTLGMVGGVVSTVVQTFLVIFTMFYVFRDGDAIRHAFYDVFPLERAQARAVVARTSEVVGASVYGVLVIAAIQGTLGGFIFWVLGLTSPLLWGVVMFFLSMIPMAGAFLVWAPAALVLVVSGAWVKGLFLTAWGVLVVGIDRQFPVTASGRQAGPASRAADLFLRARRTRRLRCARHRPRTGHRRPDVGALRCRPPGQCARRRGGIDAGHRARPARPAADSGRRGSREEMTRHRKVAVADQGRDVAERLASVSEADAIDNGSRSM